MTTPFFYGKDHFEEILNEFEDLTIFHQTSVNSLSSILQQGSVYSTGTLWGIEDTKRRAAAKNANQIRAWQITAEAGFIDYVFSSSINYLKQGSSTFGTVSLEFEKNILLDRETFIFPRATRFDFNNFKQQEKSSDTTLWIVILNNSDKYSKHEILIRRKMDLGHLVRVHCYKQYDGKIRKDLQDSGYGAIPVVSYSDPKQLGKADMKASINGMTLNAYFVKDSNSMIEIYNTLEPEYAEFYGKYEIDADDNILESVILTSEKVTIGKLVREAQNVSSHGSKF